MKVERTEHNHYYTRIFYAEMALSHSAEHQIKLKSLVSLALVDEESLEKYVLVIKTIIFFSN